jgi:hypothetical protein
VKLAFRRVAVLPPKIVWAEADAKLRRAAASYVWNQQLDVCMRVPTLSIAAPAELGGGVPSGLAFDPDVELERTKNAFTFWRREELLQVALTITAKSVSVTLHAHQEGGVRDSFDAVGADLGVALSQVTKARSEERRVGKECRRLCRSRWSPYH